MTMSGPQRLSAEAFAIELLQEDPQLDYSAIRERAREAGIAVQPIHYGRARKQLGLPNLVAPPPAATTLVPPPAPLLPPEIPGLAPPAASPAASKAQPVAASMPADEAEEPAEELTDDESGDSTVPTARTVDDSLVAPRRKGSPAFDLLLQLLRNDPHASYATAREHCATHGFQIAPIMYGRAKAVLGLVPVKPRGKKNAPNMPRPAGQPLQLRQVESVAAVNFSKHLDQVRNMDQLMAVINDLDTERKRLRDVMERVIDLLDQALGS